MRRLFTYDDGRLKTGRVAALVFILLMTGFAVAYKISRPVDTAMLAVKHVFEAEPVPVEKAELPAEAQKHKKPEAQPEQRKQKQAGEKTKEPLKPAAEKTAQASAAPPPPGPKANVEKPVQAAAENLKPEIKTKQIAAMTEKKIEAPLKVGKQANEKQPIRFKRLPAGMEEKKEKTGKVTLASSDYLSVYKSWQKAGEQGGGGSIPLRIENLKQVYQIFQMKAVALVDGKPYVDLSDGSRIAAGALDEYSTTCFIVSNPFEKWGSELKRAGLHEGNRVEVRYYMYDFIRNAIYARANQAFACCRRKGLIPDAVKSGSVDLLGRAYGINRKGGGGFGVFVPVRIDLPGGGSVDVDPSCFAGSRDIDALVSAGLLK